MSPSDDVYPLLSTLNLGVLYTDFPLEGRGSPDLPGCLQVITWFFQVQNLSHWVRPPTPTTCSERTCLSDFDDDGRVHKLRNMGFPTLLNPLKQSQLWLHFTFKPMRLISRFYIYIYKRPWAHRCLRTALNSWPSFLYFWSAAGIVGKQPCTLLSF